MKAGEEAAKLLALRCYSANITCNEFEGMSVEAREWMRITLALTEPEFRAALRYVAEYRERFSDRLRLLRTGVEFERDV